MKATRSPLISRVIWLAAVCLASGVSASATPALSSGRATPLNGNLATRFTFQVTYTDPSNAPPPAITLVLDDTNSLVMAPAQPTNATTQGQVFRWQGTLPQARHRFHFAATGTTGDLTNHWGPAISDQPLAFRHRFFFLDTGDVGEGPSLVSPNVVALGPALQPVGDMTGDGVPDLAWADPYQGATVLLRGPPFLAYERLPFSSNLLSVVPGGDATGDGIGERLTYEPWYNLELFAGRATKGPVLTATYYDVAMLPPVAGVNPVQVPQVLDLNGDGVPDWVLAQPSPFSMPLGPEGQFDLEIRYGPDFTNGLSRPSLPDNFYASMLYVTTDVDQDGYPDVLCQRATSQPGSSSFIGYYPGPGFSTLQVLTNTAPLWQDWINLDPVQGGGVDVIAGHLLSDPEVTHWFYATNV